AAGIGPEAVLSYGALADGSARLAAWLQSLGVGPEVRVGLCMERGALLPLAMLGILKAGGAYVPLDPAYPQARLEHMLEDSGVALLVTQASLAGRFAGVETVLIDGDALERVDPAGFEAPRLRPEHLAYVIYTSGSTGTPKGVGITHGNALAHLGWATATFGSAGHKVLASTSICFDLSVFELFYPLASGQTAVLAEALPEAHGLVARHGVTLVNTVPWVI